MKTCVFCGRNSDQVKITKEHVLPKWMKKTLPHERRFRYSSNYAGKDMVRREINGQTSFDMVVSRVCKDCNNGWMSIQLEAPLKETLTKLALGQPIILEKTTLNLLCLWAFKTSIIRALMDNGDTHIPAEYYSKAAKMELPDGCSIYIAYRGWENDFYYTRFTTLKKNNNPGFICAIEIRALVFFVICSDHHILRDYLNDTCERIYHPNNVIKIWPPSPSLVMANPSESTIVWPLRNKLPLPSIYFADAVRKASYAVSPQ